MKNGSVIFYWAVRILAAIIMLQTLYFKFSGASESIYIFTQVHMEPWGRIGVGVLELTASVLILFNTTAWMGGVLALGLMGGAIIMHVTILGIEINNDGGQLFVYALVVAICSVIILLYNKTKITDLIKNFLGRD